MRCKINENFLILQIDMMIMGNWDLTLVPIHCYSLGRESYLRRIADTLEANLFMPDSL